VAVEAAVALTGLTLTQIDRSATAAAATEFGL